MQVVVKMPEYASVEFKTYVLILWLLIKIALNQRKVTTNVQLAHLWFKAQKYLCAEDALNDALVEHNFKTNPMQLDALYYKAFCRYRAEDYLQAMGHLKLLSLFDQSPKGYVLQAQCYSKLEDWENMEIAARSAYLLDPFDEFNLFLLVNALIPQGKFLYANIELETLLRDDKYPNYLLLYQNWFEILVKLKKYDQAISVLQRMLLLSEQVTDPDNNIAQAFMAIAIRVFKHEHLAKWLLSQKDQRLRIYLNKEIQKKVDHYKVKKCDDKEYRALYISSNCFPRIDLPVS